MEYKKKMKYDDDENGMCPNPKGYGSMGMKMKGYHSMNGYMMKGEKHYGPAGWWGL